MADSGEDAGSSLYGPYAICHMPSAISSCSYGSARLHMRAGHDLMCPAARPVDGQAFAAELMRKQKGGCDVLSCGGRGQIDGLRYAAVTVPLEDRLHPNMVGR